MVGVGVGVLYLVFGGGSVKRVEVGWRWCRYWLGLRYFK